MTQNQRRSAFRLRWGEDESSSNADQAQAPEAGLEGAAAADDPAASAAAPVGEPAVSATPSPASTGSPDPATAAESTEFLRDLVSAMRGVAESSRDASLADLRKAVTARIEELQALAAEQAEELRRRAELDIGAVGDWERAEMERIRSEAEQKRDARRAQLSQQLADHQAAADREVESTQHKLTDHERALSTFFADLSGITDPTAFVAAAKRLPPAPDLGSGATASLAVAAAPSTPPGPSAPEPATPPATPEQNGSVAAPTGDAEPAASRDMTLAGRLAELDERLSAEQATTADAPPAADAAADPAAEASDAPATAAEPASAAPASPAPSPAPSAAAPSSNGETSTAVIVKGLGSFGAITSFKQALERVDGVKGVTLSLGPTGEFVYRASHASDFDLVGAIRTIEGPTVEIDRDDTSLHVTIGRPR